MPGDVKVPLRNLAVLGLFVVFGLFFVIVFFVVVFIFVIGRIG